MAGRSIGKAWRQGKGKPRDALCRKLACCLCVCVCVLGRYGKLDRSRRSGNWLCVHDERFC
jgi:hypothetical protein